MLPRPMAVSLFSAVCLLYSSFSLYSQPLIPGVGERTGEGNDLYHKMIETGVINCKFDTSLTTRWINLRCRLLHIFYFTRPHTPPFSTWFPSWTACFPASATQFHGRLLSPSFVAMPHPSLSMPVTNIDSEDSACGYLSSARSEVEELKTSTLIMDSGLLGSHLGIFFLAVGVYIQE